MKERPIIFSSQMVRAILDGRKTQTRRLVKETRCPYGEVGDRLWVRETWAPYRDACPGQVLGAPVYRATWPPTLDERHDAGLLQEPARWRPSIHMPRGVSRITLEITAIKLEQLKDISDTDVLAEGIEEVESGGPPYWYGYAVNDPEMRAEDITGSPRSAFMLLWDKINGKRAPWSSNPWVWALSFRVLEAGRRGTR